MNILMISSEVSPFAKTGGLADVAGSLPVALQEMRHDVRVIMPRYRSISEDRFSLTPLSQKITVLMSKKPVTASLWESRLEGKIPVYLIDAPSYFDRSGLYGTIQGDYQDNAERFSFFSRATLEASKALSFQPDILHGHDWQSALVPVYLKILYEHDTFFRYTSTMLTIHNLGYQGLFESTRFSQTGLPREIFSMEGIEFYGKLNFLKGGLLYADLLTTVSKTYSREIQTKEYGCGLEGVLQKRSLQLHGIVNGLNCDEWDPATDAALKETYNVQSLMGKAADKKEIQCRQGLVRQGTTPLIGMVTRLAQQKGFDILVDALEDLMKMGLQLIILGTGDAHYQKLLLDLAKDYPHRLRVIIGFEDKLAHQIYAGCDLFLMPSKYEPCGISQLISLRYGTIPIVRKTGGLADTVTEFNPMTGEGHGFLFEEYSAEALIDAVKRALVFYRNPQHWRRLVLNAMKLDFSWKAAAARYVDLYEELRARRQA